MTRYDQIKAAFAANRYRFFDKGAYNVNLYGIRFGGVDAFNDILGIAFRDDFDNPICLEHKGTTKPGAHWLKENLGGANGTAILIPGQYAKCWKIGLHKGYEALSQNGMPFSVWRDKDKDGQLDATGAVHKDVMGLNMHTTSFLNEVEKVGAYSAGCQVRQHDEDHKAVMEILKRSASTYGDTFSYTLFDYECV